MSAGGAVRDIPQGLKPGHSRASYGTAEAVPLQNAGARELMG
jgi:hypothetical protein